MSTDPAAYEWFKVKSTLVKALYFDPASHRIYAEHLDGAVWAYEDCMWKEWRGVTQNGISVGQYVTRALRAKSRRTLLPTEVADLSLILANWDR